MRRSDFAIRFALAGNILERRPTHGADPPASRSAELGHHCLILATRTSLDVWHVNTSTKIMWFLDIADSVGCALLPTVWRPGGAGLGLGNPAWGPGAALGGVAWGLPGRNPPQ